MKKILLLHGALGSDIQLLNVFKNIDGYEYLTFNFSGHGGKDFGTDFSIHYFAEELKDFILNNNLYGIDIFGYSMGGFVVLYLASFDNSLLGKIFTLGTMLNFDNNKIENEVNKLNTEKIKEKVPKFAEILIQRHKPINWEVLVEKTKNLMLNLVNNPDYDINKFANISNEILLALGDKDDTADIFKTIETMKIIKNSKLLVIPDCVHPIEKMNLKRLKFELDNFFYNEI